MLIRKINEHTINDFLIKFSYETRDTLFSTDEVNKMLSSFLDSYLKIFYSSFPLKRVHIVKKKKYCKIISVVIKEAKKLNYGDKILKTLNKNKPIWDTVNSETNKTRNTEKINTLNIDGNSISNH